MPSPHLSPLRNLKTHVACNSIVYSRTFGSLATMISQKADASTQETLEKLNSEMDATLDTKLDAILNAKLDAKSNAIPGHQMASNTRCSRCGYQEDARCGLEYTSAQQTSGFVPWAEFCSQNPMGLPNVFQPNLYHVGDGLRRVVEDGFDLNVDPDWHNE